MAAPNSILKKRPLPRDDDDASPAGPAAAEAGAGAGGRRRESDQPKKKIVLSRPAPVREEESEEEGSDDDEDSDEFPLDSDEEEEESDEDEDDEDAIRAMGEGEEPKPKKPKHTTLKPTAAPEFSSALTHLLSLPPSSSTLQPRHPQPSTHTVRLERKAAKLIRDTKSLHLARGHVRDVIAGWSARPPLPFSQWESEDARRFAVAQHGAGKVESGAEREKRLRKLAQRGVVRLFNAIAAAQGAPERKEREERRSGKSEAGSVVGERSVEGGESKTLRRPNVLGGRGKGEALSNLSKASFLDLIRAGTTTV
ncbi:hypothetical protein T439DRAFT_377554 [Meredithblackwellia eburnea MCA 4105]